MKGAAEAMAEIMVKHKVELMDVAEYIVDIITIIMKMTSKENEEDEAFLEGMINLKFVVTITRSLVTLHRNVRTMILIKLMKK